MDCELKVYSKFVLCITLCLFFFFCNALKYAGILLALTFAQITVIFAQPINFGLLANETINIAWQEQLFQNGSMSYYEIKVRMGSCLILFLVFTSSYHYLCSITAVAEPDPWTIPRVGCDCPPAATSIRMRATDSISSMTAATKCSQRHLSRAPATNASATGLLWD